MILSFVEDGSTRAVRQVTRRSEFVTFRMDKELQQFTATVNLKLFTVVICKISNFVLNQNHV
jgi:hypothetical protein